MPGEQSPEVKVGEGCRWGQWHTFSYGELSGSAVEICLSVTLSTGL